MKNLKKVFAVATAIAALSASMTAFAEKTYTPAGDLGFTYDSATNAITVTNTDFAKAGTEMTLLVLKTGTVETNVGQNDILYIDQDTKGTTASFQNMGLKGTIADLVDGSYPVKLGYYDATSGEFAIKAGTLTVAEAAAPGGKDVTFKWGDINLNGDVNIVDAGILASYIAGVAGNYTNADSTLTANLGENPAGFNFKWGDINLNGEVNIVDAGILASFVSGIEGTYTDSNKTVSATTGKDFTITVPAE